MPRYKLVVEQLNKLAPDDPEAVMDEEWVEKTSRRVANSTEKIEADLKSYKHNLIKESIRVNSIDPVGKERKKKPVGRRLTDLARRRWATRISAIITMHPGI